MAEKSRVKSRGLAAAFVAGALGFLVSGCAYSLSEFAEDRGAAPTTTAAAPAATGSAIPLEPAALLDDGVPLQTAPPPATTASLPPSPAVNPMPAPPPKQPESKLLTPEEKAKVIAELEALARSQKVTAPPARPQTRCTDETLDPAERLRREMEGIEC